MTAKIALRIAAQQWMNPDLTRAVVEEVSAHEFIQEVALFTAWTHGPLPLTEIERRAEKLASVLPIFREAGVTAGINHLATLGHIDENPEFSLDEPWQRLVDSNGRVAQTGFCFSDERMQKYVEDAYALLAAAGPDFIWIDDDIRLEGHRPLGYACFCDRCLAIWSRESGREWHRVDLVHAFDGRNGPAAIDLRRRWLQHNRDYVSRVLERVRGAVPSTIPVGFMTSPLAYSGAGYAQWAQSLRPEADRSQRLRWRPGAGFYTDARPEEFVEKVNAIAAEIAPLDVAADIQYELENFPYRLHDKSVTAFVAEIAGAVGAGTRGALLNIFGTVSDAPSEYRGYLDGLRRAKPLLDHAVDVFGESRPLGLAIPETPDLRATLHPEGEWLTATEWESTTVPAAWSKLGIPFAYSAANAAGYVVEGDSALAWNSTEARRRLEAGGVIMDGRALSHFAEMGLSDLVGFEPVRTVTYDVFETLTADPLNGEFTGVAHDCRPSFDAESSHVLATTSAGSRVLAELSNYGPTILGPSAGVFENPAGGRNAVLGYYAWSQVGTVAKGRQLKNIVRWVTRDTIPLEMPRHSKAAVWVRRAADGRVGGMIVSCSLDPQDVTVRVRGLRSNAVVLRSDGTKQTISPTSDASDTTFVVKQLQGFQAALLIADTAPLSESSRPR